ncbi:MAG: sodium-dependent transporter [Gammaproteobacteria bacterium]|nr:MAG: sodium-dependent transporter [Gammaproteobacteria bacterium]
MARPGALGGWRSRTTFVLALSASAVGLGNLWRFSYLTGEHGGAPFVLTYVLCLFLIAVPVMVAEVVVGSHGRAGPLAAIRWASDRSLRSRKWMLLGVLACITGLLILSYYVVVAGWSMAYARYMQSGLFSSASAVVVGEQFEGLLGDPARQVYWQSLFLLLVVAIVGLGVRRGLGLLVWLAVPALVTMLAILIKFGFDHGDLEATRDFLFSVKLVDFSAHSALVALGQAFYSLGVGVATGISYGAYAPRRIPIGRSVMAVAVFDTMIALLAGLAIFPIVFANNLEPTMGPGLMFVSLPYAFGNIMQGELFGTVFFALVVLVALGSAVAIMEPIVATIMQQARLRRFTAVLLVGALVWVLGLVVVVSLAPGEASTWFGYRNLFGFLNGITAGLLLPVVALSTALFVGWRLRPEILRLELYRESDLFFSLWRFLLRYIVPPAITLIMLAAFL